MSYYFINQNNYQAVSYNKPSGEKKSIKSSGCGVCASFNAISNVRRKKYFSLYTIKSEYEDCGARTNNGTDIITGLRHLKTVYGGFTYRVGKLSELTAHLKKGGTAILLTTGGSSAPKGLFSTGGHYICAVGVKKKNKCEYIEILDSALYNGKYSILGRKNYAVVTGNTVRVKTSDISKCGIVQTVFISKAKLKKPTLVVSTKSLPANIREKPTLKAKVVGTVPKGSKVTRIGKNGRFYHIKYKKTKGYCAEELLR